MQFFFNFHSNSNSKADYPNKGNQLSKHVIHVFIANPLICTGAKSTGSIHFPLRKSVLGKGENFTDGALFCHLFSAKP